VMLDSSLRFLRTFFCTIQSPVSLLVLPHEYSGASSTAASLRFHTSNSDLLQQRVRPQGSCFYCMASYRSPGRVESFPLQYGGTNLQRVGKGSASFRGSTRTTSPHVLMPSLTTVSSPSAEISYSVMCLPAAGTPQILFYPFRPDARYVKCQLFFSEQTLPRLFDALPLHSPLLFQATPVPSSYKIPHVFFSALSPLFSRNPPRRGLLSLAAWPQIPFQGSKDLPLWRLPPCRPHLFPALPCGLQIRKKKQAPSRLKARCASLRFLSPVDAGRRVHYAYAFSFPPIRRMWVCFILHFLSPSHALIN